jgi:hypothetical protein
VVRGQVLSKAIAPWTLVSTAQENNCSNLAKMVLMPFQIREYRVSYGRESWMCEPIQLTVPYLDRARAERGQKAVQYLRAG